MKKIINLKMNKARFLAGGLAVMMIVSNLAPAITHAEELESPLNTEVAIATTDEAVP